MKKMNPMVSTIVQQIMTGETDVDMWRKDLIMGQIFTAQEARDLSEREISLIHHALLTQKFSQMDSEQLMDEVNKHNLQYHLNMDTENMQMGAVCY